MGVLSMFSPRGRKFNSFYSLDDRQRKRIYEYLLRDHDKNEHFISDSMSDEEFFSLVKKKKAQIDLKSAAVREFGFDDDELESCEAFVVEGFNDHNFKRINGRTLSDAYVMSMIIFAEDQLFVTSAYISLTEDFGDKPEYKFYEAYYEDIKGISLKPYISTVYDWEYKVGEGYSIEKLSPDDYRCETSRITISVPDNDITIAFPDCSREEVNDLIRDMKTALRRHKIRRN